MDESPPRENGFTVLDGVALVVAAAVASVHLRVAVENASGAALGLTWIAFGGVATTAAGPVLFLVRRYGRRFSPQRGLGEQLWALLGVPWLLAAPLRTSRTLGGDPREVGLYGAAMMLSVGAACLAVLAVLWKALVLTPPGARPAPKGGVPWTERLGMVVSVAWPLQCGFLLVVLDSEGLPPSP